MSNIQSYSSSNRLMPADIVVFVIPCLIFVEVRLVGRLFLSEILLLGLFPFLFLKRGRVLWKPLPKMLIVLGLLWLFSQIVTDIIRSIPFKDYARGWSNIVVFLIEFSAIYLLVFRKKKRLVLFALGIVVGQFLHYFLAPNIFSAGDFWKFGIGYAVTFLLVLCTQFSLFRHTTYAPEVLLISAALLNFVMGARSLGGICLIAALYVFYQKRNRTNSLMPVRVRNTKLLFSIILLGIVGVMAIKSYGWLASGGMLGELAQQKYESQAEGEFGLLIGGRQELLASSLAIMDSPIIGHGSWAKNPRYIALLPEMLLRYGYGETQPIKYGDELSDLIPTHSFLFGAWVSAGLLGAIFWIWVIIFCSKLMLILSKTRDPFTPVVAFICFSMFWNILFSPLGAETRVYTAYYLVLLVLVYSRLLIRHALPLSGGMPSTRIQTINHS